MRPKVYKKSSDWYFECKDHDELVCAGWWSDAIEAAFGHWCMHHKLLRPAWEIVVSDGIFETRVISIADKL